MNSIYYSRGWKYKLAHPYWVDLPEMDEFPEVTTHDFLILDSRNRLFIKRNYAWDGPSGPAIDSKNFMRGSLVHDALYQFIREEHLPQSAREAADAILYRICREDGMSLVRAKWVYWAVRKFGPKDGGKKPDVQRAPRHD